MNLCRFFDSLLNLSDITSYLHTIAVFVTVNLWTLFYTKYTGLSISPSGISDPCGTVAGMVTPKGSMSTEGETPQVSVLPYRCSICAPLVTQQMSNFGKFQDTDRLLIPCPRHVSSWLLLAVKPASTPRRLVQKKLGEILYLLICSFLPCLSVCLGCCAVEFRNPGGTYE
jgi:hypothetical protein